MTTQDCLCRGRWGIRPYAGASLEGEHPATTGYIYETWQQAASIAADLLRATPPTETRGVYVDHCSEHRHDETLTYRAKDRRLWTPL